MYKIHCCGFISQHLFGDNLEELKKQVEENYASRSFRATVGPKYYTTGEFYKEVLSVKTYWTRYKNKFRYYEEIVENCRQADGIMEIETFKRCIETITELEK